MFPSDHCTSEAQRIVNIRVIQIECKKDRKTIKYKKPNITIIVKNKYKYIFHGCDAKLFLKLIFVFFLCMPLSQFRHQNNEQLTY